MRTGICFAALIVLFSALRLRAVEEPVVLKVEGAKLEGTLVMPDVKGPVPVVLIIAGSGPTDRNGNNSEMTNNSLKYFSDILLENGYASLRYDKRGIGQSTGGGDESELRFEMYVNDAKSWIAMLSADKRFSQVIVAGHSEGSLIGMLAAKGAKSVRSFISIAGPGRPADLVLKEQLNNLPDNVKGVLFPMIDALKRGDTVGNVPPIYYALMRPSIQPYMISWFRYDPAKEIAKLDMPVLVVNGTTDLQVGEKDAELLTAAAKHAIIAIIPDMNHVLKACNSRDKKEQQPYYEDPSYPLHPGFTQAVTLFLRDHVTRAKKNG